MGGRCSCELVCEGLSFIRVVSQALSSCMIAYCCRQVQKCSGRRQRMQPIPLDDDDDDVWSTNVPDEFENGVNSPWCTSCVPVCSQSSMSSMMLEPALADELQDHSAEAEDAAADGVGAAAPTVDGGGPISAPPVEAEALPSPREMRPTRLKGSLPLVMD